LVFGLTLADLFIRDSANVSLSDVDRILLQRCLDRDPRAWRDFVDRFVGLVVHVVHRTAAGRGVPVDESTRDDLVSEVFLVLIRHDLAVLRRFHRQCSLATYLTVVARRVVVRRMVQWNRQGGTATETTANTIPANGHASSNGHSKRIREEHLEDQQAGAEIEKIENAEEVQQLMLRLDAREASVVRMYHLEGMTYQQISRAIGLSENSIGPMLHRARGKMNP
jgi:RNA polymerase sigma-70 factor (ECF subfamily)